MSNVYLSLFSPFANRFTQALGLAPVQEHHEESSDWLGGAWKESIRGQSRVKDGDSVVREVGLQTAVIV